MTNPLLVKLDGDSAEGEDGVRQTSGPIPVAANARSLDSERSGALIHILYRCLVYSKRLPIELG